MKKKIAILYSGGKHFGGVETYLLQLLSNYNKDEIELHLLSMGRWELTKKLENMKITIIKLPSSRLRIKTIFDIKKNLLAGNFDLIVSQGTVANAYARAASYLSGVPSLVTVHSDPNFDYHNPLIRGIYALLDFFTRFQTRKYIAVSKYLTKILIKEGISRDNIVTIYNGVEFKSRGNDRYFISSNVEISAKEKISPLKRFGRNDNESEKLRNDKNDVVIGSVGRLHTVKGFHNLIIALSLLKNSDIKLNIAGSGEQEASLFDLAKRLGVADRVKLVGYVEDVMTFLGGIDIYVQPSLAEGFGLSVVEAMLSGVPTVVTPVGSLPELVKDGETGIIAASTEPASLAAAIDRLASDDKLQKSIGMKAQEAVKKSFDYQKWLEETIKTYKEAAK